MTRAKTKAIKIRKPQKTATEIAVIEISEKAAAIGVPAAQIARGGFAIEDVPLRDAGRVVTFKTLVNRGGTPIARWKAAKLLSDSQTAAIDYCEKLWATLGGRGLVMDLNRIPGTGNGNGWAEQEALDDLARIKAYVPAQY